MTGKLKNAIQNWILFIQKTDRRLLFVPILVFFFLIYGLRGVIENWISSYSGYEEACNLNGISLLFEKNTDNKGTIERIHTLSQDLLEIMGQPLFQGKVVFKFCEGVPETGGQTKMNVFFGKTRIIALPDKDVSDQVLSHELVHGFFQTDHCLGNYPELVIEGVAEAAACQVSGRSIPYLIPNYYDHYLGGLTGLIDPNGAQPEELVLKNLYYSVGALFLSDLARVEPGLLARIVNYVPDKKVSWAEFLQKVINQSYHKTRILERINRCTVIGIVSQRFFAIPIRSEKDTTISVILYLDPLKNTGRTSVTLFISNKNKRNTEISLISLRNGVGLYYPKKFSVHNLQFYVNVDGIGYETIIP